MSHERADRTLLRADEDRAPDCDQAIRGGAMSASQRPQWRSWILVLTSAPFLASALSSVACSGTVGSLILNVRGHVSDIVVVDPRGREDRYTEGVSNAKIPGCSRWPGGVEDDEEDTTSVGSSAAAFTMFQLDTVEFGLYLVYAKADSQLIATVSATFQPSADGAPICAEVTRTDRVSAGRHGWIVILRRYPPKGECTVRIAPLVPRKKAAASR